MPASVRASASARTPFALRSRSQSVPAGLADLAEKIGKDLPPREEWPHAQLIQVGRSVLFSPRYPTTKDLVTPRPCAYMRPDSVVAAAFRAARSARFEHGEKPSAA